MSHAATEAEHLRRVGRGASGILLLERPSKSGR